MKSGDNDKASVAQVWFIRIELIICNFSPPHTTPASSIDDACMDLAEGLLNVIMKSGGNTNASCPKLNMSYDVVGVVRVTNVKPDKIIKLETLPNNVSLKIQNTGMRVP